MPDIEFIDDGEPSPAWPPVADEDDTASRATRSPRFDRDTIRAWGPAALATVAAVLAVVAPWQNLYGLVASGQGTGVAFFSAAGFSVDGWGRLPGASADGGTHGSRYGILLCVAAALLLAGAALPVYGRLRRHPRAVTVGPGLLTAGVGLLAGVIGAAALEVSSTADNFTAQTAAQPADQDPAPGLSFHVATGAMVWLGLAAVVLGLAAVVLPLVLRPRATAEPADGTPPPLALPTSDGRRRYVPHADDEPLDV